MRNDHVAWESSAWQRDFLGEGMVFTRLRARLGMEGGMDWGYGVRAGAGENGQSKEPGWAVHAEVQE